MAEKVVAKFKVQRFESTLYNRASYSKEVETMEMRTIVLSPVYANNDPDHENSKFWNATPSGEIKLGTINPEAWQHFELGKEYYVTFEKAE